MTDTVKRIDEVLSFYSAGLGTELSVPTEKDPLTPAARAWGRFCTDLAQTLSSFAALMQPLALAVIEAAETFPRLAHRLRVMHVYRRWNNPELRYTAWHRKATSRPRASRGGAQ